MIKDKLYKKNQKKNKSICYSQCHQSYMASHKDGLPIWNDI